jgi:hypothetical protein
VEGMLEAVNLRSATNPYAVRMVLPLLSEFPQVFVGRQSKRFGRRKLNSAHVRQFRATGP